MRLSCVKTRVLGRHGRHAERASWGESTPCESECRIGGFIWPTFQSARVPSSPRWLDHGPRRGGWWFVDAPRGQRCCFWLEVSSPPVLLAAQRAEPGTQWQAIERPWPWEVALCWVGFSPDPFSAVVPSPARLRPYCARAENAAPALRAIFAPPKLSAQFPPGRTSLLEGGTGGGV